MPPGIFLKIRRFYGTIHTTGLKPGHTSGMKTEEAAQRSSAAEKEYIQVDADGSGRWLMQLGAAAISGGDAKSGTVLDLLILLLLILLNAAFASSEMAVIRLNDNKVRLMAEEGDKRSRRLVRFLDRPTHFLSTIQVGITFGGFFASAIAASRFAAPLTEALDPTSSIPALGTVIMLAITAVLSFVSLVFGELVPKRIAMHSPDTVLKYTLGLLRFTSAILRPFVWLLTGSTNLILKIFGIRSDENDPEVTEEEIRMMVNVGREKGSIHEDEKEMIENIFELNDTQVSEIMTHRTNVTALSIDASFEEVMDLVAGEKFTRIPVYRDSIDNIIGILHIKDLLLLAIRGLEGPFGLAGLVHEPFFIPETRTIDSAFRDMQKAHAQFAVVIDEYGGTAGIITMEDLLEEIVGNIQDEYDEEPEEIVRVNDNTFLVDGQTGLDEIADATGVKMPEDGDYDTVAGLMIDLLGRIPDEDERPEAVYANLTLAVSRMDDRRISEIRITVNPAESEGEAGQKDAESHDADNS